MALFRSSVLRKDVLGFIVLAALLGACLGGEVVDSTSASTTTSTTTTTLEVVEDVKVTGKDAEVATSSDKPSNENSSTSLPSAEEKAVDDTNQPPLSPPATSEGGGMEKKEAEGEGEAVDMMKDPYRNVTVEDTTTMADKDVVTVVDSHVVDTKNKTHEEEASSAGETTTLPPPPRVTDQLVSKVFFIESTVTPPMSALVVDHSNHDHMSTGKISPFSQPTAAAAILAGVLIGVALAGYVGLIAWRKVLEKRYGNREMLVNEDDDLHHFEL